MPDVITQFTMEDGGKTHPPGSRVAIATKKEAESLVARGYATWPGDEGAPSASAKEPAAAKEEAPAKQDTAPKEAAAAESEPDSAPNATPKQPAKQATKRGKKKA